MKFYTGKQYVQIALANAFGNEVDKLPTFEEQIAWAESVNLEEVKTDAKEVMMFQRALDAYYDCINNRPTGFTMGLDGSVSGCQMASVLMGDMKAAVSTGLANNKRGSFYQDVANAVDDSLDIPYSMVKEAVMTALYQSTEKPRELFGDEGLPAFFNALEEAAPEVYNLLEECRGINHELQKDVYRFTMPNGATTRTPTYITNEVELEMCGGNFKYRTTEQGFDKSFNGMMAHICHTTDAFVATEVGDRLGYNPEHISNALHRLDAILGDYDGDLDTSVVPSVRWLDELGSGALSVEVITQMFTIAQLANLEELGNQVLKFESSPNYQIHDEFWSYPDAMNGMRYHYQQVMGQIAQSDLASSILSDIYGYEVKVGKDDISEAVFNGEYGIS